MREIIYKNSYYKLVSFGIDVDFGFDKLYVWDSKSLSDRTVPLPLKLKDELQVQVKHVETFRT